MLTETLATLEAESRKAFLAFKRSCPRETCTKCRGRGVIPGYQHQGGECSKCDGTGRQIARSHEKALEVAYLRGRLGVLRGAWRATRAALASAEAAPAAGPAWAVEDGLSGLRQDLARLEATGRETAAALAAKEAA